MTHQASPGVMEAALPSGALLLRDLPGDSPPRPASALRQSTTGHQQQKSVRIASDGRVCLSSFSGRRLDVFLTRQAGSGVPRRPTPQVPA